MSHDGLLEVAFDQRALQEGVIHQIQLAGRQIVGGTPVGVKLPQLLLAQRLLLEKRMPVLMVGMENPPY